MTLTLLGGGSPGRTAAWPGHELGAGAAWCEPDLRGGGGPTGYRPLRDMRR